jgi:hydrogenase maturation protease
VRVRGELSEGRERVLVGGVGYRWLGDASFGVVAADELGRLEWPSGVDVEDLGYGALLVALDLAEAWPAYDRVILLAGMERGREPGRLYRYRWSGELPHEEEIQARVREAGAGVIDIDHLLVVAQRLGALPGDVRCIELEPPPDSRGEVLTAQARRLLEEAVRLVRHEVLGGATADAAGVS